MKEPADPSTTKLHIGREFIDVTWRIAAPVLLFVAMGLYIDVHWGSKPWMTLVGTVLGFGAAAWLVKRQIGELEPKATTKTKKGGKK